MANNPDEMADMIDVLEDIKRWVKIIGIQEAKPTLDAVLSAEDEQEEYELRIIYHLSDGEHSSADIENYVSVSSRTISRRRGCHRTLITP